VTGLVLTADAVSALATGSSEHARILRRTAATEGVTLALPAAAYTVAFARTAPAGRWLLGQLVDLAAVVVDPLDAATARAAGVVLARATGAAALRTDIGQAVVSARARGWPLLSVDAGPLMLLATDVDVVGLP
jgi:hypothetical protein